MFSWEKRRLKGDFITLYNCLKGCSRGWGLVSLTASDRMREHSLMLHQGRLSLGIWKNFFGEGHDTLEWTAQGGDGVTVCGYI